MKELLSLVQDFSIGLLSILEKFVFLFNKKVFKVLVIVVYLLTAFISFTAFSIIIPYEQVYS